MVKKKHVSEEAIKARLREVTEDLRRLRTELNDQLRHNRTGPRPFEEDGPRIPLRRR